MSFYRRRNGDLCFFLTHFVTSWLSSTSHFIPHSSLTIAISLTHDQARDKRTKYGHDAAVPLYRSLFRDYPDITAATRIAAASNSPWRHDRACPIPKHILSDSPAINESKIIKDTNIRGAISDLKQVLEQSNFNNENVQQLFGISTCDSSKDGANMLNFSQGPVYIKPVRAGDRVSLPFMFNNDLHSTESVVKKKDMSLKCLVTLFLLGFAVPKKILSKNLIGGDDTVALLEYLGLAFPCEIDPGMIVPYVHLFPMDVKLVKDTKKVNAMEIKQKNDLNKKCDKKKALVFVTDLHPRVLSRTTVGEMEDGAVMYIGPDSLALVQHLPLNLRMAHICDKEDEGLKRRTKASHSCNILDFCSGSGVQALSTLASLEDVEGEATAVCVDVNDRALRFTHFNALLNGICDSRIKTIKADLTTQKVLEKVIKRTDDICESKENDLLETLLSLESIGLKSSKYDIILANPPFIPVPPLPLQSHEHGKDSRYAKESKSSIAMRYGLFSSGGVDGEDVLKSIMKLSSRLIRSDFGLLAIVSEFMNPPLVEGESDTSNENKDSLLWKMENWWSSGLTSYYESQNSTIANGKGLLFTNQYPLSATTYASRRASDETEFGVWCNHLESKKIHSVSPGLMFIETRALKQNISKGEDSRMRKGRLMEKYLRLSHYIVPKTGNGSIWTPSNKHAVTFTNNAWADVICNSI